MNYKGYKDLECYKQAGELRIYVSGLSKKSRSFENFSLAAQINASGSITANIGEGYGRFMYTDTRNFFTIARGSVTEVREHLTTSYGENYISTETGEGKCETVFKLINGYMSYLDRSKSQSKKQHGLNS